jgi:uncharacterized membrane protein YcjF (UPF0283 family)
MDRYAKLIVALGGAVLSGATLVVDGWQASDYFTFAAAIVTAVGVGLVPNKTP